ncbi:MAG: hypothetical protein WCB50_21545, partial [Pseudolabrys sp.]
MADFEARWTITASRGQRFRITAAQRSLAGTHRISPATHNRNVRVTQRTYRAVVSFTPHYSRRIPMAMTIR